MFFNVNILKCHFVSYIDSAMQINWKLKGSVKFAVVSVVAQDFIICSELT
jgi:hypothetical protein